MKVVSPVLLEASLEYIDRFKCREYYTNAFQKYITTKDKFCARSKSGNILIYDELIYEIIIIIKKSRICVIFSKIFIKLYDLGMY